MEAVIVAAMLAAAVDGKGLPFRTVLMDGWYATQKLMAHIDQLGKVYDCPLKRNRRVDDSGGTQPYQRIDELTWDSKALAQGKRIKICGFRTTRR